MNSNIDELSQEEQFLRALLNSADDRQIDAPASLIARCRERLLARTLSAPIPSMRSRPAPATVRWSIAATAAAAVFICAVLIRLLNSAATWAQVAQAVQEKPWIHLSAKDLKETTNETWLSFSRDVTARHAGNYLAYDDFRAGVRFEYDHANKKILRLPLANRDMSQLQSLATMFRALFRGDTSIGDRFADDRIVAQKQRTIDDSGRKWLEYELELQRGGTSETAKAVIRVDLANKLPVSIQIEAANQQLRLDADYPDTGPADIYALGLPRDIAIEDRMPPADLARIVKMRENALRDLDNYFAVVTGAITTFPEYLIWRKGDNWRIERCFANKDRFSVEERAAADQTPAWWRERLKQFDTEPYRVCDGRRVYEYGFSVEEKDGKKTTTGQWKVRSQLRPLPDEGHFAAGMYGQHAFPEFFAYERLGPGPESLVSIDTTDKEGPPSSVLVKREMVGQLSDSAYRHLKYWLDPDHGYANLRTEYSGSPLADRDRNPDSAAQRDIYEFRNFRQSPRGVWYPTLAIRKVAPNSSKKDGETRHRDTSTYFYLDFVVSLPDELFKPTSRKAN